MASMEEVLEGPALMPPPGVKPNFIDPPNQIATNLAVQSVCLITATTCVFIRMYTKFIIMRTHGWEDYTCFIAWLGLIAYVTLMLVPVFNVHAGVHQWDIRLIDAAEWAKIANGIEIAYIPVIFITKLSILLLYLKIFVPGSKTTTYWVIQAVILFNLLFYLANIPVEIWSCVPREKIWNPTVAGHCINNENVFVAGGTINMVSDFTILLLPIISISRLQMRLTRKIGVSAVFATGLFGCIASIMHLVTSVQAAKSPDTTYYSFPLALWTLAEISSGIICGCLICMPNFFRHFAPKISSTLSLGKSSHSKSKSSGSHKFSFKPVRAQPEEWDEYNEALRSNKDSYLELGERNSFSTPAPAVIHHEVNVPFEGAPPWRGNQKSAAPVSVLPSNVMKVADEHAP